MHTYYATSDGRIATPDDMACAVMIRQFKVMNPAPPPLPADGLYDPLPDVPAPHVIAAMKGGV